MRDGLWCRICGNELDQMGPRKWGCLSCYQASGPDWSQRWLADCAAAARETGAGNVIPFLRKSGAEPLQPPTA